MQTYDLCLDRYELIELALAVSAAAISSGLDDSPATAAGQYAMASKLWGIAGYDALASEKARLARDHRIAAAEARADAMADDDA